MHFVFDGGTVSDGAGIVLQLEELDDFRFADPGELAGYLAPSGYGGCRPPWPRGPRARPCISRTWVS